VIARSALRDPPISTEVRQKWGVAEGGWGLELFMAGFVIGVKSILSFNMIKEQKS
jgi:hypothetical protein